MSETIKSNGTSDDMVITLVEKCLILNFFEDPLACLYSDTNLTSCHFIVMVCGSYYVMLTGRYLRKGVQNKR